MTTATQILKARIGDNAARRIQLSDLSETGLSRPTMNRFEPLLIPADRSSRVEKESAPNPHLESAVAALKSAVNKLHAHHDNCLDQSQHEAVRLGVAIAERLLRRTLAIEPSAIIELIQSALEWSIPSERLRVRLHPDDAELITETARPMDTNREIDFLADDTLARGDCIIESSNGQIDARLKVILQRITDELLDDS